jgi:hypothetical protein
VVRTGLEGDPGGGAANVMPCGLRSVQGRDLGVGAAGGLGVASRFPGFWLLGAAQYAAHPWVGVCGAKGQAGHGRRQLRRIFHGKGGIFGTQGRSTPEERF